MGWHYIITSCHSRLQNTSERLLTCHVPQSNCVLYQICMKLVRYSYYACVSVFLVVWIELIWCDLIMQSDLSSCLRNERECRFLLVYTYRHRLLTRFWHAMVYTVWVDKPQRWFLFITSLPHVCQFSKFFHCWTQQEVCNKTYVAFHRSLNTLLHRGLSCLRINQTQCNSDLFNIVTSACF